MSESTSVQRVDWIDVARGFAMVGVIYGHILPRDTGFGLWVYNWHMPIFFAITGMLLSAKQTWRQLSFKDSLAKESKALLYPYFVFCIIDVIIAIFRFNLKQAISLIPHVVMFNGVQAIWFIPALLIAKLLFTSCAKRSTKLIICILVALIFILPVTSYYLAPIASDESAPGLTKKICTFLNIFNRGFIGAIFVGFGYFLAPVFMKMPSKLNALIKATICLAVSLGLFFLFHNRIDLRFSILGNPVIFYVASFAGILFVFAVSQMLGSFGFMKLIKLYGKESIILLTTHLIFRDLLAYLWPYSDQQKFILFGLLLVVEFILIFIIRKFMPWLVDYKAFKNAITFKKSEKLP